MPGETQSLIQELTSGDDQRAEAAALALAAHGKPALPRLQDLLKSPDPERRWWAARALAEVADPQAGALLRLALSDGDPTVRQCAALGLRQRPDPAAIPDLADALDDPDRLLAHLAADALAACGPPAMPALLAVIDGDSQPARLEAMRALAALGDEQAIPALFKALDEGSALMEYWANAGLERLGVGMTFFKP
ncbi:MAG TPA: HEAT repeat domain-containing protein [Anaerolineales bacterium]|nr:HEAT repeat domain-containing protein [Anaerolineales bacterium]